MDSTIQCLGCGATVERGQGIGLCAACVLRQALSRVAEDAEGTQASGSRPVLPTGDYQLLNEIARGGMGVVYRALQVSLHRIVALKVLSGGTFAGEAGRRRLQAEAAAAARLRHPHIVPVYGAGQIDGQPFYVMEYVNGKTLADAVKNGPMAIYRAARYVGAVAEALDYAHSQGVLHRDLKPSNVLLDEDDEPRVTDFGLAKPWSTHLGTHSPDGFPEQMFAELTSTGQVVGSPAYMSPEQARGNTACLGPTSDVYSIGAILYELLTGRPPFVAQSPLGILAQVIAADPIHVRRLNPSVPADLETICEKCLEKEPSRRYATAGQLAEDLHRFLRREPVLARPIGAVGRTWRWMQRRPLVAGLTLLSAALVTVALAVFAWSTWHIRASRDEARARLAQSLISEGRALRLAGDLGHRDQALRRFAEARQLDSAGVLRDELRRETIASLARHDARRVTVTNLPRTEDLMCVCFDLDFNQCALAVPGEPGVSIYQVRDDKRIQVFRVATPDEITAFNADGRYVLLRYDGSMAVGHVPSGTLALAAEPGVGRRFNSGGFSDDGRWLARAESGDRITVYEVTGSLEPELTRRASWPVPRSQAVGPLVVSPSGEAIALALADESLVLCEAKTGKILWERFGADLWSLAWNRALDAVAYHSPPNSVRLLSARDGRELRHLSVPDDDGAAIAFSPDGFIMASAGAELGTRLLEPVTGRGLGADAVGAWHLRFDSTGRRVGSLFDAGYPAWLEWEPSSILIPLHLWTAAIGYQALVFDHSGDYVLARTGGGLVIWSLPEGKSIVQMSVPAIRDAVFDPHSRRVFLVAGGELRVLDHPALTGSTSAAPRLTTLATGQRFWTIAVSATKGLIAAADSQAGVVTLVDREGNQRLDLGPIRVPGYVAFSPDDRWLACGAGTRVYIWDVDQLKVSPRILENVDEVIRFSYDGRWLMTLGKAPRIWDTISWEEGPALPFEPNNGTRCAAALSLDGKWLAATQRDREVRLIDLEKRTVITSLDGPGLERVVDLAFSPNGQHLAAARAFGEVQVWDLAAIRKELKVRGLDW